MLLFSSLSIAQTPHKCAAVDIEIKSIEKDPSILDKIEDLENETREFIENKPKDARDAVYTIPVVVHIIHDGEDIGEGQNISDAKIMEQIDRLNEDFQGLNADKLNDDHPYYPIQADCQIEFCLAQLDPDGEPTTGINRYEEDQESWTLSEIDEYLKPATIWDRYNYLNIWSINIEDPDAEGVDGFGTFPGSTSDTTDGVVIAYWVFGSDESGEKTIVGTHEVGHYLNVRHVWGDNQPNCGDDLVDDTPPSAEPNEGCPTFPHNPEDSCGTGPTGDIFMNFMDYSDPECTVMFTNGQKDRMHATLSTARESLTLSNACGMAVGITENSSNASLIAYPNPSNGFISFNVFGLKSYDVSIYVYNVTGSQVYESKNMNNVPSSIDISELPNGIYYLSVVNAADVHLFTKIIISK